MMARNENCRAAAYSARRESGARRRHQRQEEDRQGGHEAPTGPQGRSIRGLPVGSPAVHLVGRRWKNPHKSTAAKTPRGTANVSA